MLATEFPPFSFFACFYLVGKLTLCHIDPVEKDPAQVEVIRFVQILRVGFLGPESPPVCSPLDTTVDHEIHNLPQNLGVVSGIPLQEPLHGDMHLMRATDAKPRRVEDVVPVHDETGVVVLEHCDA